MKREAISDLDSKEISALKRRYLIWLYKTTKESLDRIDRKLTQLDIDKKIFKRLKNTVVLEDKATWQRLLDDFRNYIDKKEKDAINLKYVNSRKHLKGDYLFLKSKLRATEELISDEFGKEQLRRIKSLYEEEMVRRIIEEREHR